MSVFELLLIYWEPRTASTFHIKKPRLKKEPSQHLGDCLCRFWLQILSRWTQAALTPHKEKQRSRLTSAPPNTAFPLQFSLTVQQPEMILFVLPSAILISELTKNHGNHHTSADGLLSMEGRFETNPFSNSSYYLPTCDLLPNWSFPLLQQKWLSQPIHLFILLVEDVHTDT